MASHSTATSSCSQSDLASLTTTVPPAMPHPNPERNPGEAAMSTQAEKGRSRLRIQIPRTHSTPLPAVHERPIPALPAKTPSSSSYLQTRFSSLTTSIKNAAASPSQIIRSYFTKRSTPRPPLNTGADHPEDDGDRVEDGSGAELGDYEPTSALSPTVQSPELLSAFAFNIDSDSDPYSGPSGSDPESLIPVSAVESTWDGFGLDTPPPPASLGSGELSLRTAEPGSPSERTPAHVRWLQHLWTPVSPDDSPSDNMLDVKWPASRVNVPGPSPPWTGTTEDSDWPTTPASATVQTPNSAFSDSFAR